MPTVVSRIRGFGSPLTTASGLTEMAWDKPGDKIPFELTVDVEGDPNKVKAEVWTNANHNDDPDRFDPVPMTLARVSGKSATFRTELPIDKIGNYRATGRVKAESAADWRWIGDSKIGDLRFRPRDERHDALNIELLNVGMANFDPATKRYGTFADLMDSGSPAANGKVTLEWLASQGVNALWLQPVFEIEKWDRRHPADDAGSPYAVKDYLSIRSELARSAQGKTGDEAWAAGIDEFKKFIKKCDSLGIKVILDVALNHVGHNYQFRDLFIKKDANGHEVREVRKNDFSQVAGSPEQLAKINARIADPKVPKFMEYLAPHMYGRFGDPHGARRVEETAPGGWFEWPDTKQLNHGRMRYGYHWWDTAESGETRAVLGWLTRILQFWAVDVGVHGFRLDHLTGMPEKFLERSVNLVQADVDRHQPGKTLFFVGEDFHTGDTSRHWLDAGQGGWFHDLKRARSPEDLRRVVENPWFHDLLSLGSHDEERYIHAFGGDRRAATRMLCLLSLLGGPVVTVLGDEAGEWTKLAFKQYRGVPSLRSLTTDAIKMMKWRARAGALKRDLPALKDDNRGWMKPRDGGSDPGVLAVSRWTDSKADSPLFMFSSFDNTSWRENVFSLDDDARARVDPNKKYQVVDRMSEHPDAPLWAAPRTGKDILDSGVFVRLAPYQIQVLELRQV